jgi:Flp pilus assembly protein TadG
VLNRLGGRPRDERGAVMVMFAIMLVVLLGMAGLVVDIGFADEQQNQLQNSVDAAALAAAQDLPNLTRAAGTVQSYVATNIPGVSFAWSTCTDANKPVGWQRSTASACISFDPSFTQIRVKLPPQTYSTSFARAVGVNSLTTGAVGQARVVGAGFGSIEPFALFSGFAAGLACVKETSSGHQIVTCDDPSTGNFNLLDIAQYGNSTLQTPTRCGNSFQRQRMIDNIAIGADHEFSVYGDPNVYGNNAVLDACGTPDPNTLPPRPGNDVSAFDLGIVHGVASDTSDGGGARLTRYPTGLTPAWPTATALGATLDNKPLWEFIKPGHTNGDGIPASCYRETFTGLLNTTPVNQQQTTLETALEKCFTDYETGNYTGLVFDLQSNLGGSQGLPVKLYDIQLSPRFAYVPQFVQTIPPNGSSSNLNIASFRSIYMEDVYADCNNGCNIDFAPGPWNTTPLGAANKTAAAMTAWVFPPTMLPASLRGNPSAISQNHYIQLSK